MPEIITENLSVNKFSSVLGALSRSFESCRPTHVKPSHSGEFTRLAILLEKLVPCIKLTNSGQIVDKYIYIRSKKGN